MINLDLVHDLSSAELDELRRPRTDLLIEAPVEEEPVDEAAEPRTEVWCQQSGPFSYYERRIEVDSKGPASEQAGRHRVRESIRCQLAIPFPPFRWIFQPPMRRALASTDRQPRDRWWWSRDPVPARTTRLLTVVAVIAVIVGYLGVIIGQTITFATQEFSADDTAQGDTLAAVRIGVLLSVLFLRFADVIGRRPLLIWFTAASIVLTAVGAFSPSLFALGASQAVARGLATGLLTLVTLIVAEEVPAENRSLGIGLITMATGFGGGIMVAVLPLADLGPQGWRVVYLIPLLGLPAVYWAHRALPETRRFAAARARPSAGRINRKWFLLLATSSFLATTFLSPASQFLNEYLNDELDYSAAQISLFRLIVYSPIGIFIIGAGILADRFGRRPVGVIGIGIGAAASALTFSSTGAMLWLTTMAGAWMLTAAYTALRGYQTELFPTKARAKVGGWLDGISVSGSALGLVLAGRLSDYYGRLGPGIAWLLIGPAVVVVLLIVAYPETARKNLEELNPGDPELDPRDQPEPGLRPG